MPYLQLLCIAAAFAAAKLSVWNNRWSEVHDFSSPSGSSSNWSYLDGIVEFGTTVTPTVDAELSEELSLANEASAWKLPQACEPPVVPYSVGIRGGGDVSYSHTCAAVLFVCISVDQF